MFLFVLKHGYTEARRLANCPIQLDELASYRADRDPLFFGKTRGGGLFTDIKNSWCRNAVIVSVHCSELEEVLAVRCPRVFTVVIIIAVYIPPSASINDKASGALSEHYKIISDVQTVHPDSFFIVTGNFNKFALKSVLPEFHENIDLATRDDDMLDLVYRNIPPPHWTIKPHLHTSHSGLQTINKQTRPVLRDVKTWPEGAIPVLQDCFEHIVWHMFREAGTYTDTMDLGLVGH